MKRLLVILLTFLTLIGMGLTAYAANPVRAKSVVLLIYNNQAHKYYNAKLDKIAMDQLNKKIEGIYYEADTEPYTKIFAQKSYETTSVEELLDIIKDSNADYFVYTELRPFSTTEDYNLIYHNKSTTATMVLRIINVNDKKELFADKYALTCKDEADYGMIGNPSMAKKSLEAVLFKVGEAISVHLPL
jgi:hypothetical protein